MHISDMGFVLTCPCGAVIAFGTTTNLQHETIQTMINDFKDSHADCLKA
jgi:hypothetical protein